MVDLTAEPTRLVMALALMIGAAQVVSLHAPEASEQGTLYRDEETFRDVSEADTLLTLRRRRGESNIKFAARLALKLSEVSQ